MAHKWLRPGRALVVAALSAGAAAAPAGATSLILGNLLVSRSVYDGSAGLLSPGTTVLPPGCLSACTFASSDGTYPFVFNNDLVDASFGITSKIFLDQLTPFGARLNSIEVPNSLSAA
jgi:hypothetical protein